MLKSLTLNSPLRAPHAYMLFQQLLTSYLKKNKNQNRCNFSSQEFSVCLHFHYWLGLPFQTRDSYISSKQEIIRACKSTSLKYKSCIFLQRNADGALRTYSLAFIFQDFNTSNHYLGFKSLLLFKIEST